VGAIAPNIELGGNTKNVFNFVAKIASAAPKVGQRL
jgi:hypothetical protein